MLATGFLSDLKQAGHTHQRRPAYFLLATAMLILTIGASTSMFTLANTVLFRSLPVTAPERLVNLREVTPSGSETSVSAANFVDWQTEVRAFRDLALISGWGPTYHTDDQSRLLRGLRVTANFLTVLGVRPLHGRDFNPADDRPGAERVVMLAEPFWRAEFGGDPTVVGRAMRFGAESFTVIGVAPAGATRVGFTGDVITPVILESTGWLDRRGWHIASAIGRLADGTSLEAASAAMDVMTERLADAYPATNEGYAVLLRPLHDSIVGDSQRPLLLLLGAVLAVLLIACANLANLTLSRGAARSTEWAVHAALGATRGRLLRRLLADVAWVGAVGGVGGVAASALTVNLLRGAIPSSVPRVAEMGLDWSVALFAAGVTGLAIVLAGVFPLVQVSGVAVRSRMSSRGTPGVTGPGTPRAGARLVVLQSALMVVLLVGSGLFLRSLANLRTVDLGLDVENLHTATVIVPSRQYPEPEAVGDVVHRLVERVGDVPGVDAVAATSQLPFSGQGLTFSLTVEGIAATGPAGPSTSMRIVTPTYFETVGARLLAGRLFNDTDVQGAPGVVVVSEEFARRYAPNRDPLGLRISYRTDDNEVAIWETVVGVVADVRHLGPAEAPIPEIFRSFSQADQSVRWTGRVASLIAKSEARNGMVGQWLDDAVRDILPGVPVRASSSLAEYLGSHLAESRFQTRLIAGFGLAAALLALTGVYGVLSLTVVRGVRSIAIRMALGSTGPREIRRVLVFGVRLVAVGGAIGLIGAASATRFVRALLFEVGPFDPTIYLGALAVATMMAVLAGSWPAVRAARVNPAVALRE